MKQEDARVSILAEWPKWRAEHVLNNDQPTGAEAYMFCGYLDSEHPRLLNFKCAGDKWQHIKIWLTKAGYIKT